MFQYFLPARKNIHRLFIFWISDSFSINQSSFRNATWSLRRLFEGWEGEYEFNQHWRLLVAIQKWFEILNYRSFWMLSRWIIFDCSDERLPARETSNTLTHELGHSLGSDHDSAEGSETNSEKVKNRFLMFCISSSNEGRLRFLTLTLYLIS